MPNVFLLFLRLNANNVRRKNERAKLGNMLAAVTGMRCGEIQALRFKDLGNDCLYVKASWNKVDDLKPTKTNEARTVEIPFPALMHELFEQAKQNPWGVTPDSFVFWSDTSNDMPMHGTVFLDNLRKALIMIGYTETKAAQYMFHGWRHFFTSYMIRRLDKKLLKSQTGHKTDVMLAHYADHCIEGDRELIQAQEREAFAGILPHNILLLETAFIRQIWFNTAWLATAVNSDILPSCSKHEVLAIFAAGPTWAVQARP